MTYKQALREGSRKGWGCVHGEPLIAAGADILARRICMNAETIYNRAIKEGIDLFKSAKIAKLADDPLGTVDTILSAL